MLNHKYFETVDDIITVGDFNATITSHLVLGLHIVLCLWFVFSCSQWARRGPDPSKVPGDTRFDFLETFGRHPVFHKKYFPTSKFETDFMNRRRFITDLFNPQQKFSLRETPIRDSYVIQILLLVLVRTSIISNQYSSGQGKRWAFLSLLFLCTGLYGSFWTSKWIRSFYVTSRIFPKTIPFVGRIHSKNFLKNTKFWCRSFGIHVE